MNTRNKEDIPTRNFKRRRRKKHHKLETDDFPRDTKKKKRKQNRTKKTKNEKPQQKTKNPSETPRKIFKCFRLTNFWKTKMDMEFLSAKHYLSTLFHFPTCKIR